MAYTNYNYVVYEDDAFSYSTTLYLTLSMTFSVLLIWFIYASNYRYSSERIASKLVTKYTGPLKDDQSILSSNGSITSDKKTASADVIIRNKDLDGAVVSKSTITLPVKDDCSFLDKTCVKL